VRTFPLFKGGARLRRAGDFSYYFFIILLWQT
jgi:hypothetical protein